MICDWCGEPISSPDEAFPGYGGLPTHRLCQHAALKAQREDRSDTVGDFYSEREPFTDWPNSQGTYD